MITKKFVVGRFFTNCYIAACKKTKEAIIIDPGYEDQVEAQEFFRYIESNSLRIKSIVDTHGHPDHACGNGIMKEKFQVPILIHEKDNTMLGSSSIVSRFFAFKAVSPPADTLLYEGNTIRFGETSLKVLHTPGHSPGSTSLVGKNVVFTGDTLFAGSIGRTDFPNSSTSEMKASLQKLANLPDQMVVHPGHGPSTNIGQEKRSNPFMQFF
ncbi:MAG: MBL fold metallo-hydrolase [Candidatus Bathyarchaeota archaeon]|jgi:glyoxylase-like metal-dependent hydrolase (beta-lactamase superfamily II)